MLSCKKPTVSAWYLISLAVFWQRSKTYCSERKIGQHVLVTRIVKVEKFQMASERNLMMLSLRMLHQHCEKSTYQLILYACLPLKHWKCQYESSNICSCSFILKITTLCIECFECLYSWEISCFSQNNWKLDVITKEKGNEKAQP